MKQRILFTLISILVLCSNSAYAQQKRHKHKSNKKTERKASVEKVKSNIPIFEFYDLELQHNVPDDGSKWLRYCFCVKVLNAENVEEFQVRMAIYDADPTLNLSGDNDPDSFRRKALVHSFSSGNPTYSYGSYTNTKHLETAYYEDKWIEMNNKKLNFKTGRTYYVVLEIIYNGIIVTTSEPQEVSLE